MEAGVIREWRREGGGEGEEQRVRLVMRSPASNSKGLRPRSGGERERGAAREEVGERGEGKGIEANLLA